MKKYFAMILILFCTLIQVGYADEFKDNRLKFDSSRIEQEKEEDSFGKQSALIKDLFSESDQKKLAELQEERLLQLLVQQDDLFVANQKIPMGRSTETLFLSGQQALIETKVDLGSAERQYQSLWLSLLYISCIVMLVLGATYITYRIYTRDV